MGGYGRCWHPTHTPGAGGLQGGLSVVGSRRRQRTVPSGERAAPSSATDGVPTYVPDEEWGRVLHDADLVEAILDRVLERGRVLPFKGPT